MTDPAEAIERYTTDLRRYARALLRDPGDADELVQDCLLRALSRKQFWWRVRDVRAYLFAIMHNAYVDRIKSRRGIPDYVELDQVTARLSEPAAQIAALELRDLARGLARLPEEQRQVVLLVGMEGMSYQQAAEILGIPIGTVMSRLSRGREALRQSMEGTRPERMRRAV